MKPIFLHFSILVAGLAVAPAPAEQAQFQRWGTESLSAIHQAFYMPDRSLYAEEVNNGKKPSPSWIWDASIQLGALNAAAKLDPQTYLPQVRGYAVALRSYRTTNHDRPGFDVNPPPKKPDRYYDDNAWICLSLLETYELTKDPQDLAFAMDAYNFAMSGEDDKTLSGGIYWHEDRPTSKNACSSGPAMIAALKLHQLTGDEKYLATAKRLYDWQRTHLQDDADGLIYDSISVSTGRPARMKLPYNSGTLIRAACMLYLVTKDQKYLDEAERVAQASEKRFVRSSDGIIGGAGKLGVKLVEAFLELYEIDHNDHWRQVIGRCLTSLHEHRNQNGWYPQDWDRSPPPLDRLVRLIDQAAPARAYWIAVMHGVQVH
jgi:rhamnogalacturonyl hydrolase YesR